MTKGACRRRGAVSGSRRLLIIVGFNGRDEHLSLGSNLRRCSHWWCARDHARWFYGKNSDSECFLFGQIISGPRLHGRHRRGQIILPKVIDSEANTEESDNARRNSPVNHGLDRRRHPGANAKDGTLARSVSTASVLIGK